MKRTITIMALLLVCQTAGAALQYEFRQVSNSQIESIDSVDYTGRGVIDGDRSRVDFLTGNAYLPGSYMISTNGSHNLWFVDPTKKTYVEINGEGVASAIGSTKMIVENFKHELIRLDDHPIIAGCQTDHYRIHLSYDLTVTFGTMPLKQAIQTTIDKWMTMRFGDVSEAFLAAGGVRTGNPQIDQIIEVETTKVKGFAVRQTISISTVNTMSQPEESQIKLDRTRTQTSELTILSIKETAVEPSLFVVPPQFRKANPLQDDSQKAPVQTLSLEPAGH